MRSELIVPLGLIVVRIDHDDSVNNYRSLNRTTSQLHPSKMPNCRLQI